MDEQYNGWTNYETWRVHLEFFDGFEPETKAECDADNLKDMVGEHIAECAPPLGGRDGGMNLAADWAMSFAAGANYREIAEHLLGEHFPEDEEEAAHMEQTKETPAEEAARLNGDNTKQPIWVVVEGRLARVTIPYVRETAVAIATDTEPEVSSWGANRFAAIRNLAAKIRAERKKAARPRAGGGEPT